MKNVKKYSVDFYFRLFPDFTFETYPFEQKKIVLEEIKNELSKIKPQPSSYSTKISCNLRTVNTIHPYVKLEYPYSFFDRKTEFLKVSFKIWVDLTKLVIYKHSEGKEEIVTDLNEIENSAPSYISSDVGEVLFDILFLSQIARPGSLKLGKGISVVNNLKKGWPLPELVNLRPDFEFAQSNSFPKLSFISLNEFSKWLRKKKILIGIDSKSSLEKALNAFSHLNGRVDSALEMVYLMMCLEILYTKGNTQIAEQLNEKIQIFLGDINMSKKQIKKMYDIRSRYFHGDLPVLAKHKGEFSLDDSELDNFFNANSLASAIVIGTFQKMFLEDLVDLDFKYYLDTHSSR